MSSRLISKRELRELIPLSDVSIWRKIKKNEFPAPIQLGPYKNAWRLEDVEAWIQAQASKGASKQPDRLRRDVRADRGSTEK